MEIWNALSKQFMNPSVIPGIILHELYHLDVSEIHSSRSNITWKSKENSSVHPISICHKNSIPILNISAR
jgi:hypothetical protein